jgi:hypothetical protein
MANFLKALTQANAEINATIQRNAHIASYLRKTERDICGGHRVTQTQIYRSAFLAISS